MAQKTLSTLAANVVARSARGFQGLLLLGVLFGGWGLVWGADRPASVFDEVHPTNDVATKRLVGTVLRVNGDAITSPEVLAPIEDQIRTMATSMPPQEFINQAAPIIMRSTMRQIYDMLLYQHALASMKDFEQLDEVIEDAMLKQRKRVLAPYGASEARAQADLARKGTTLEKELDNLRRGMIVSSYRESHYMPNMEITRSQMIQYYRQHEKEKYQAAGSIQFRLIDIQAKKLLPERDQQRPRGEQLDQARQDAKDLAEQALQALYQGQSFEEVARSFSHGYRAQKGGLWDARDPESLREHYQPVIEALKGLQASELTGIVAGEDRFFIAELIEYQPARTIPFSEVQDEITKEIKQQRWQRYSSQLSEELMGQATMGDVEEFVKLTTFAAYQQYHDADLAQSTPDAR